MTAEIIPAFAPAADIIASERIVVGTACKSRGEAESMAREIRPEMFRIPAHALIFEAATGLAGRGEDVDPVAVMRELRLAGNLVVAGGGNYLHDCLHAAISPGSVKHARDVAEDYARREMAAGLTSALDLVTSPAFDLATDGADLRQLVEKAFAPADLGRRRGMDEALAAVLDRIERGTERGIPTPWEDLNEVIPGMAPGEMLVIAARPGVGKSVLGGQIAFHAATKLGIPTLMVSMEMSTEELLMRLISAHARVSLDLLLKSQVTHDADWRRIGEASAAISESVLEIDDTPEMTVPRIRARLGQMRNHAEAGLIVIDYLGLIQGAKAENRNQLVAQVSRDLKLLARSTGIPVVALHQLNRESDKNHRRPMLSDLKDSSQIEADADVVLLLHQPEDIPGLLEVQVAKQRQGPKVTVELTFQGYYARAVGRAWTPSSALESDRHA